RLDAETEDNGLYDKKQTREQQQPIIIIILFEWRDGEHTSTTTHCHRKGYRLQGRDQFVRILLDSGSQATMITEKCANALGLKRQHSRAYQVAPLDRREGKFKSSSTPLSTSEHSNTCISIPQGDRHSPKYNCDRQPWTHLKDSNSRSSYYEPGPVDILLGADYTAAVMREGQRNEYNIRVGLCGRVNIECGHIVQANHTQCELEKLVQKFWELEQIPDVQHLTPAEQFCEEHVRDSIQSDNSGRFIVQLPVNPKIVQLGAR
ncbi:hypothetical protein Ocin01_19455, partial [Orchesella cincta]